MEPSLIRDAAIVGVLGIVLLAARVPLRWALLILGLAVGLTILFEAFISELISSG